jgi:vancomycin resistance protein YoaR
MPKLSSLIVKKHHKAAKASSAEEKITLSRRFKEFIHSKKTFYSFASMLFFALLFLLFQLYFIDKIYPGVSVAGINLTGLTKEGAVKKIGSKMHTRVTTPLIFNYQDPSSSHTQSYVITLDKDSLYIKTEEAVTLAKKYGRKNFYLFRTDIPLGIELKQSAVEQIQKISLELDQPAINSQLKLQEGEIIVTPSQEGLVLDYQSLFEVIKSYINTGFLADNNLPFKKSSPQVNYQNALSMKQRLDLIKNDPIKLKFQKQTFNIDLDTAISLLDFSNPQPSLLSSSLFTDEMGTASSAENDAGFVDSKLVVYEQRLNEFLRSIASQIDREVIEPLFTFDPSRLERVREFRAPQEGRKLKLEEAYLKVAIALIDPQINEVDLPVTIIPVKNKFTNDFGIKELIGRGVSDFTGSIPNRVYNIGLGASKTNGVIISPGEVYSFNDTVGDISAATGYKQGYIIRDGRTVLDDGGGICQVSTTVFRAALNGGFPIISRFAHAYRPVYYERDSGPGFDATIYQPGVDFKFKNDTKHHILVQSYTAGNKIYVDIYGTPDSRIINISKPVITNSTPPPPDLRQDDPTLPVGTVKQVDWAAWGANVYFTRTVTKDGEVLINETVRSNYRPWQAVYLVGTREE